MRWGDELATMRGRYGGRIGIIDAEGSHRIAEVIDRAAGIADRLRALGLGPGDFVATVFQNSMLAAAASYAVALAGATEVPVNPVLSQAEFDHALCCTGTRLVLLDGAAKMRLTPPVAGEDVRKLAPRPFTAHEWPDVGPEAPSRIVFTSGTTGPAKGAIHTHLGRWAAALLLRSVLPIQPDGQSRILLMTPFSHGSSLLTFAYLAEGASVHLMQGVDSSAVLPLLASGTLSEIFAPPTVLAKLVGALVQAPHIKPQLRMILTGTAPLSPTLYRKTVDLFGEIVRVTYGKSEIFNPITVLSPPETAAAYAETASIDAGLCVGWAATGVRIEIRDDEDRPLPHGETGRIFLHSPHMFRGYMTANGLLSSDPEDFHDTGDLGRIDGQGRLFLVARQSDMMKTGGYKVAPDEVERALTSALPDTEIIALGFPSEYWGEVITLVAERPPSDWQDRLGPALAGMTPYKRPRLFAAVDKLPRNAIGKLSRAELRRQLAEKYALVETPQPALVRKGGGR